MSQITGGSQTADLASSEVVAASFSISTRYESESILYEVRIVSVNYAGK